MLVLLIKQHITHHIHCVMSVEIADIYISYSAKTVPHSVE